MTLFTQTFPSLWVWSCEKKQDEKGREERAGLNSLWAAWVACKTLCRKYDTHWRSVPLHLKHQLQTIPYFSFELGQVGDLLALLEMIVSVKRYFRASAIPHQAVDFVVWFLAPGSGWVVQNICICSPGRYVCSDSFLCFSEDKSWMEGLNNLRGRHHCNPCKEEVKLTQKKII